MSLELLEFQKKYAKHIVEQVFGETLHEGGITNNKKDLWNLSRLNRPPFGSQVENCILPLKKGLETYKFGLLIAEMGTGKTQMSFSTAYLLMLEAKPAKRKILFLTAGSKHLPKMIKEAKAIYGHEAVVKTIVNKLPGEKIGKGEIIPEDVYSDTPEEGKINIYVLSKDTAKIDLSEEPIFNFGDICPDCHTKILTKTQKKGVAINTKIKPYECPNCGTSLVTKVGKNICNHALDIETGKPISRRTVLDYKFDKNGNGLLDETGNPIFEEKYIDGIFPNRLKLQRDRGTRKISIGKRFRRLQKNSGDKIFELLIVDEVHEMQSATSLQGRVYRDLVNVSNKTMIMTGTLSNGYPSSVFFILQAIMPGYFKQIGYEFKSVGKFVDHYGSRKYTKSRDVIEKKGSKTYMKVNELPKISDRIVSLMAPFTVWLKMEDLNLNMPSYSEKAIVVPLDEELLIRLNQFKSDSLSLLSKHNPKGVKAFAQRFMYLQNNPSFPYKFEFEGLQEVVDEETLKVSYEKKTFETNFQPFEKELLFNKEKAFLDEVKRQMKRGRKILCYSIYNTAAKVADRLKEVLETETENPIRVKILPESVSGERIESWVEENADDCDVLIASPIKLATGLDLCQFPTIIFYESGVNLRIAQQAARRSWRAVGQSLPVEVVFMAYQGIQAHILDIMSKKMKSAATIEGTKVQDGQLAAVFDDDADFTAALNAISDELRTEFNPDFSSSFVEEGKLRPATKMEVYYEDLVSEYLAEKHAKCELDHSDEEVEEEISSDISETVEEETNIIEIEESNKEESVSENIVSDFSEDLKIPEEEIKIKISKNNQMFFEF